MKFVFIAASKSTKVPNTFLRESLLCARVVKRYWRILTRGGGVTVARLVVD